MRKASQPAERFPEPISEFTDVPLSLPTTLPVSAQEPSFTQVQVDQNEKTQLDQSKDISVEVLDSVESEQLTQDFMLQINQTTFLSQPKQCEVKTLMENIELLNVSSLYPSLPVSAMESQLLANLSLVTSGVTQASQMSVEDKEALRIGHTSLAPAVLPLADQEASPPSLVPVQLDKVERIQERLYPDLPNECQMVQPFTSQQLKILEPASWLENVELHALEFRTLVHCEGHELHELLLNYWRCRKQLIQVQAELQAVVSDCKSMQNRLWTFKDEQLTLQVRKIHIVFIIYSNKKSKLMYSPN